MEAGDSTAVGFYESLGYAYAGTKENLYPQGTVASFIVQQQLKRNSSGTRVATMLDLARVCLYS